MFFPLADHLGFTTGGTEAMRITDNNELLIATTTARAEAEPLQVNGMAYVKEYLRQANSLAQIDITESTTTQTIANGTTWTTLDLADGHNHFEAGDVTPDYDDDKITIEATGTYLITLEMSFESGTDDLTWKFNALLDGVKGHAGCFQKLDNGWGTADKYSISCSSIYEIATAPADITIGVMHDLGSSVTIIPYRCMLRAEYKGEL